METDVKQAPPRVLSVPQTPVPQTCFGVLNQTGSPPESRQIMDFPPDFSWMTSMEIYLDTFRFPRSSTVASQPRKELWKTQVIDYSVGNALTVDGRAEIQNGLKTWHMIPFTTSRWWNGTVKYRFMAIKPPRVTGKILISYFPDGATANHLNGIGSNDLLRRSIKKEWDLGQSSDCEFEISAFNVIEARPTWVPRVSYYDMAQYSGASVKSQFCSWGLPIPSYNLGALLVEEAQELQPGSIFPDSIRILVFISFQNCNFWTQCDPRSNRTHVFDSTNAHNVSQREIQISIDGQ